MRVLVLIGALVAAGYALALWRLLGAWRGLLRSWRQQPPKPPEEEALPSVSVLVPARNEANNLPALLQDLAQQDYPHHRWEVLLIDDGSTDGTPQLAEYYREALPLQILHTRVETFPGLRGKKAAIRTGIEAAQSRYIITTDADCRVRPLWLRSMATAAHARGLKLLSGPVTFFDGRNRFQQWQQIEFASLVGTGAASLFMGKPNMCNGANLLYERQAFHQVGGFSGNETLASGDDEFLLHKIHQKYPGLVGFLPWRQALVQTAPQPTWSAFRQQRQRWASKWAHYADPKVRALALAVLGLNGFFLLWPLLLGGLGGAWAWGFVPWAVRAIADYFFLRAVLRQWGQSLRLPNYLGLSLLYPFYVLYFGFAGLLRAGYIWKDQNFN